MHSMEEQPLDMIQVKHLLYPVLCPCYSEACTCSFRIRSTDAHWMQCRFFIGVQRPQRPTHSAGYHGLLMQARHSPTCRLCTYCIQCIQVEAISEQGLCKADAA